MPEFTLDLLGPIFIEMREETRDRLDRIEARLTHMEARLDTHHDELTVVSGLTMRATGERVAWDSVHMQLRKINDRLNALETGKQG